MQWRNTLVVMLGLTVSNASEAQKGLNSIYSAYGIGDVELRDYNPYSGMGGVGVAMGSEKTLNSLNPASFATLQKNKFMFELSFAGKSATYINENQRIPAGDFSVKRAAFGISLFKNVGTVIGLKRYSTVEYLTVGNRYVLGTDSKLEEEIEGSGGLNQFYFANGFSIKKNLRLGISVGYLFGSVNRNELIYTSSTTGLKVTNGVYYNKMSLQGGLQYAFKTGSYKWTIGGTYQPRIILNKTTDNYITDMSDVKIAEDKAIVGTFHYPEQFSGGVMVKKGAWGVSADYIQQSWGKTGYKGNGFTTTTATNFAVGANYTFTRNHYFYGKSDGVVLSAGFVRDLSYLIVNGRQISSNAGTIGLSIPSKNSLYNYYVGLKAGKRGEAVYPLVKENFVEFHFNFSLSNFLFNTKARYD